jgi:hypothetical protein
MDFGEFTRRVEDMLVPVQMLVRQLQGKVTALEDPAPLREVASIDVAVVALGAGAALNTDFANLPQAADMALLGGFENAAGSQQLQWTWGMFGSGIRVTVVNPTGGALSGTFRGVYVQRVT